ncbi:chitinase [Vibrio ichthyoenteri ATCC 700023]|uniref:chitinase n=1 Tax=Vibrio ichthyoenteri ATCC 700023 TaxID=870968 RepID=F9S2D0_9VIBR|nr:glycosyl hydrolase family 18 protein [Vibrio ichthyoenteri]EGU39836.1 chitinase [Vibrio ichthyoenteri ATCC 700023]
MNKKISALSMAIAVALASTTASASIATGLSNFKIDHAKTDVYSNSYKVNKELPEVTAYLSNWTHYQQGYVADLDELSKYDTVLLSFFGLCGTKVGDPSVTGGINGLATSCAQFGLKKFELSSTDSYADLEKQFPGMGMSWQPDLTWKSPTPNGLLGVMKKLHEEKGTRVGISIFGWSLSNIASDAVKPENRAVFLNSLIDFVRAYPFIGQLDIDWEYPGIQGAPENVFDPVNDAKNYREFIAELRTELDKMGRNDVVIGIASGAPHDKIDAAKLKDLVEAGVDNIHLMTYDFFGQWDTTLNHHTNLYSSDDSKWSADKAIQYMIQDLGIPSKNIQLGYANYSRNAIVEADIQASPLRGDFRPVHNTAGTFEAAVTSVNDLFENFVTVSQTEKMEGKNGYKLYTDAVSNADFVYNESNKLFVSIDTPRSVFAKAQYVNKHNLGGIFTWMADHDEGLMLNAAREGLGYEVKEQVFNMEQLINSCGVNITSDAECKELTNLFDGNKAPSVSASDKQAQYVKGGVYDLSALINGSTDVAVKHVTWTLEKSSIGNENIAITDKGLKSVFTVNHNAVSDHVVATFNVEVTFANNTKSSDTMTYTLKVNETIPEIESISHRNTYKIGSGEELAFTANASDDLDRNLAYSWKVTPKDIAITSDAERVTVLVDTNELPNKPEYNVQAEVTVTNKFGNTDIMSATTTVIGNPDMNAAPTAMFTVKSEVLEVGDIVEMTSISTDELPKELSLNWQVTLNGGNIAVDQSRGHDASFDTDVAGSYSVTLTAIDVFGISSTKTKLIEVSERLTPQECEVKDDNADSYPQWNATTIYTTETVGHNGLVYTAKWWTQGNEPTPTAEMWKLESEVELPWSVEAVYHGGDQVDYEGKRWEAKWWTQGSKPSESSDVWFFVGEAICK